MGPSLLTAKHQRRDIFFEILTKMSSKYYITLPFKNVRFPKHIGNRLYQKEGVPFINTLKKI